MENGNEKFSPSSFFLYQASSSRRDSLQPLRIVLCSVAASSAFVALLLSKAAAAVAPVSLLFLLGPAPLPPPTTYKQWPREEAREEALHPGEANPVNAGGSFPGYNSGPFHLYTGPECANI